MTNKYIIKNCPSYNKTLGLGIGSCLDRYKLHCKSISDCPLKQIAELCRDEMRFDRKSDLSLASDIMSFLEIEEA